MFSDEEKQMGRQNLMICRLSATSTCGMALRIFEFCIIPLVGSDLGLSWPKLQRSQASEEWLGFERRPRCGGWERLGHEAMVVLHVNDNKIVAKGAIDLGEGWGEGDEVVVAVEVWLENVVDLMGEEVAVRFRVLIGGCFGWRWVGWWLWSDGEVKGRRGRRERDI
ncbi:hypothetical protein Pyn_30219 [Prunus yedoensis var. nudiflora]|uniref:Uncharacterized protein n=1 Tax=Prunus yedoensis var. nudiflora TaxID=2094558 RepID=A0A314YKZ8_PRUYE|nr:hypothetical protein Pyn_30219 [Prunus yedoensis var. nudiflora]